MERSMFMGVFIVAAVFTAASSWSAPYVFFGALPALFFLSKRARTVSIVIAGLFFDLFSSHMFGTGLLLAVLLILAAHVLDTYRSLNAYLFGFGTAIVSLGVLLCLTLFRLPPLLIFGGIDAVLDAFLWQFADIRILFAILIGSICAVFYARRQAVRRRSAFFSL